MKKTRYEKWAEKKNKREREKFPLLAMTGDIAEFTPDDYERQMNEYFEKLKDQNATMEEKGEYYRLRLRLWLDTEEYNSLVALRERYPATGEYHYLFWFQKHEEQKKGRGSPSAPAALPLTRETRP